MEIVIPAYWGTLAVNPPIATLGAGWVVLAVLLGLFIYLLVTLQESAGLKARAARMEETMRELEHQARLIIKSDMELKLYQEEVEDKLNKLSLLKNLLLSSIHIVDTEDLFAQINDKTVHDLGFNKGLILNFSDLATKLTTGFSEKELVEIKNFLLLKKKIFLSTPLICGEEESCQHLSSALGTKNIMLAAVKAKEDIHALFILAEPPGQKELKTAEKATLTVICIYLGQCIDNIRLFEQLYLAKDELESKIKEKTGDLVRSLREIEVINRKKTDFISSVSHELRTPLTSVKGFSALLVEEKFGKLPEEAKKRLEKIDENVNKLVEMVNTLLDIARIESGKTEVKIMSYDLVKVIKDTADFFLPQVQAKQIKLVVNAPDHITAQFDKNLIERVFINLINNALKFTPAGGTISVACAAGHNQAQVSVADTGCGMSKVDLEKLFSEFFRADNTVNRQVRGTGLGLSLVKRIIETHHQKIWVESELDKGTTFHFTLKI